MLIINGVIFFLVVFQAKNGPSRIVFKWGSMTSVKKKKRWVKEAKMLIIINDVDVLWSMSFPMSMDAVWDHWKLTIGSLCARALSLLLSHSLGEKSAFFFLSFSNPLTVFFFFLLLLFLFSWFSHFLKERPNRRWWGRRSIGREIVNGFLDGHPNLN